jgi:hypothetical protein
VTKITVFVSGHGKTVVELPRDPVVGDRICFSDERKDDFGGEQAVVREVYLTENDHRVEVKAEFVKP